MKKPLTKKELYAKLLPLKEKMTQFKETNSAKLTVEETELMKDVYSDINVLSNTSMAQALNTSCPSCVRDAFHIFISVFDRLEADPHVNTEVEKQAESAKNHVKKNTKKSE